MNRKEIFTEFDGTLEDYSSYLNRVSDFIKEFENKLYAVNQVYEFPISETECLVWENKRLRYSSVETAIEGRPLIECKKEVRIQCLKFLKPFMKKICSELEKEMD